MPTTRTALEHRLEEAYRADAAETERLNREWERADAEVAESAHS